MKQRWIFQSRISNAWHQRPAAHSGTPSRHGPSRRPERLRFSSFSGRSSVAQHDRIIALCEAGDVERAVAATRANWQTLLPLLDTAFPDGEEPGGRPGSSVPATAPAAVQRARELRLLPSGAAGSAGWRSPRPLSQEAERVHLVSLAGVVAKHAVPQYPEPQ